jgi:glycosyltransferase involved in cell wall biosynthesis
MRIAVAGTLAGLGGIQIHLSAVARVLADAGHEVLLLSFGNAGSGANNAAVEALRSHRAIRVEFVGAGGAVATLLAVRRVLKQFGPEIYFACGTGWNLFAGAILCRVPMLVFHEVMSGESYGWRDSRNLVRRFFHRVVAQAQPVADNFARSFDWKHPIEVLPAFAQALEGRVAVSKHTVPLGAAKAAIFGRLVPHKRVAWLVTQWPRLKAGLRELHIHGTGPEEPIIRDLIAKHRLGGAVFLHGAYPSGGAYAELLSHYDVTLLPTVGAEGAPLVLLESMACGVPFVATDAGGIRDYDNPDCIVTSVGDSEDFLNGVETLANRLAHGEIDQHRLQTFYDSHFSQEALAPRWKAFFNSLPHS